jgi:hypothetical protein
MEQQVDQLARSSLSDFLELAREALCGVDPARRAGA